MLDNQDGAPNAQVILRCTLPWIGIYAIFGVADVGRWILSNLGVTGAALDIGPHIYNFVFAFMFLGVIPWSLLHYRHQIPTEKIGTIWGDRKWGAIFCLIGLCAVPMLYIGSTDPALIAEYPLAKSTLQSIGVFILFEIAYGALYYTAYEFQFRGMLQLGLSHRWGTWKSILFVTILTTALHWNKPLSEIIGAFAVGFVFGIVAWKTRSWYYVFAIHYLVGLSTDVFCGLRYLGMIG
jgi:membrane protease YdiL (CAAX protease family)